MSFNEKHQKSSQIMGKGEFISLESRTVQIKPNIKKKHRNRKKIVQSVRIKPPEIHKSGNENFLVRLGYGRFFALKLVRARARSVCICA